MAFGLAGLYALKGVGGAVQAGIGLNQMAEGRARAEALERAGVPQMSTAQEYFDLYQNASRSKQFEQEKAMNQSVLASNLATLQGAGSRAVIGGANAAQLTAQRGMATAAEADFARQQDALSALAGAQQQTNYLNFQAKSQQYASDLTAAREAFTAGLETAVDGVGSAFTGFKGYLENRPEKEGLTLREKIVGRLGNRRAEKEANALAVANNAASVGSEGQNINPNANFFATDDFGLPSQGGGPTGFEGDMYNTLDLISGMRQDDLMPDGTVRPTFGPQDIGATGPSYATRPERVAPLASRGATQLENNFSPGDIYRGKYSIGTGPAPMSSPITDYFDYPEEIGASRATGVSRRQQRRNRRSARRAAYDPYAREIPMYYAKGGSVTTPGKYTADHSLEYDVKTKDGKTIATLTGDETLVFNPKQRRFLKRIIGRLLNGRKVQLGKEETKTANETLKAFKK